MKLNRLRFCRNAPLNRDRCPLEPSSHTAAWLPCAAWMSANHWLTVVEAVAAGSVPMASPCAWSDLQSMEEPERALQGGNQARRGARCPGPIGCRRDVVDSVLVAVELDDVAGHMDHGTCRGRSATEQLVVLDDRLVEKGVVETPGGCLEADVAVHVDRDCGLLHLEFDPVALNEGWMLKFLT